MKTENNSPTDIASSKKDKSIERSPKSKNDDLRSANDSFIKRGSSNELTAKMNVSRPSLSKETFGEMNQDLDKLLIPKDRKNSFMYKLEQISKVEGLNSKEIIPEGELSVNFVVIQDKTDFRTSHPIK